MGKKVSHASLKICKNEKKQFNSFIKVLRPKVYITDSSSFKRLVQELTGNGSTITSPPHSKPHTVEHVPVIDIEDRIDPESSMEPSIDASIDSSELGNYQVSFNEDLKQTCNDQFYLHETSYDISSMNQQPADFLAYQDLESWLLDVDQPRPFYNGYAQIEQEVSIYDYELSGLL